MRLRDVTAYDAGESLALHPPHALRETARDLPLT